MLVLLLVVVVGAVLVLAVVVALFAPGTSEGCGALDGSGEPVGPSVGSLGGVAGSGITRAELESVRSSPLAGSKLTTGAFRSTAYGPPWGGLQGLGVATAGGLLIAGGAPKRYLIATDPRVISLGQWVYVWPNPFGWRGPFLAADRRFLGKDARRQTFSGFEPQSTRLAWCAWFTTNVWRLAGVPVELSYFSGYHYAGADEPLEIAGV